MTETSKYLKNTSKNPLQRFLVNQLNKKVIDAARSTKSMKILDVGCREGFLLVKLARSKVGKAYEGIDSSDAAIKLGHKLYPTLNIKTGDIYNLPYKDDSFDLLICTEVFEHLKDPKKAMAELKRVTRKYIAVSAPNQPFFLLSSFFRGKRSHPKHINRWTYPSFKKFVRKNGLKISSTKSPFPWTLVLARK